jgi:hypothetical protein
MPIIILGKGESKAGRSIIIELNAGNKKEGRLIFEVPDNARLLRWTFLLFAQLQNAITLTPFSRCLHTISAHPLK